MAVTNYYTVNGAIIGESTGGVRTDYMVDALGSVTGTVNQSGQVQNTYRYKPYGPLLAKTGTAADPKFQWVGTLGYRQTGRRQSDYYVRARHYGSAPGMWATVDPLWPGQPYYAAFRSAPTVATDRLGLDPRCSCNYGLKDAAAPMERGRGQWVGMPLQDPRFQCYKRACNRYCNTISSVGARVHDMCTEHGPSVCGVYPADALFAHAIQEQYPFDICIKADPEIHKACSDMFEDDGVYGGGANANWSHWPNPEEQAWYCGMIGGSFCDVEAQMRECCARLEDLFAATNLDQETTDALNLCDLLAVLHLLKGLF